MIKRGRPKKCKHIYKDPDTYFEVNVEDKDIEPVRISLPSAPQYFLIDGYGLPPEEQYFKRLKVPDRILDIEREARRTMRLREERNKNHKITADKLIQTFWDLFEQRREHGYDEMVEWLKEVHWCRKHGYWFFNDGKPTYISGEHFDYLNFWSFPDEKSNDGGFPEYRDIDRTVYLFRQYAKTTTEKVWVDDDGVYRVKDMGVRVCFGTVEPKSRRCGITTQALHAGVKDAMTGYGRYFTIISMEGDNAEKHYTKKLVPSFQSYPMWLKPIHKNQVGKNISFTTGASFHDVETIGGMIDYTDSAGESKNDGDKLHYALCDEEGKTLRSGVNERWSVNRQAMALGARILGFSIHPTTVEDMDVGGREYMEMCNQSKFFERGEDGQTASGLFEIYVPAWKRLEGFVDRFGMPVVNAPTERQRRLSPKADFAKFNLGAREYLQQKLDDLLSIGTPEALENHRSRRRKFPMKYSDLWIGSSGDVGFDMEVIDNRLMELRRNSRVRTGRMEWEHGFGSSVKFIDDPNGHCELSMVLDSTRANQKFREDVRDRVTGAYRTQWRPTNPYVFTASTDAFKAGTSNDAKKMGQRTRQSDGGIAVLWEFDESVDGEKVDQRDWDSHRFVFSYRYRPDSLEEYQEDALKVCVYFGAMWYGERNMGDVDEYFLKTGFGGYLLYDIDPASGKRAEKPGFASYERAKINLFLAQKDYIRFRGHKEEHASYLEECKAIQGLEQMGKYDRFTAHGGCLLGSKQNRYNMLRFQRNQGDPSDVDKVMRFFSQNF